LQNIQLLRNNFSYTKITPLCFRIAEGSSIPEGVSSVELPTIQPGNNTTITHEKSLQKEGSDNIES
jgi:hypothetical protein